MLKEILAFVEMVSILNATRQQANRFKCCDSHKLEISVLRFTSRFLAATGQDEWSCMLPFDAVVADHRVGFFNGDHVHAALTDTCKTSLLVKQTLFQERGNFFSSKCVISNSKKVGCESGTFSVSFTMSTSLKIPVGYVIDIHRPSFKYIYIYIFHKFIHKFYEPLLNSYSTFLLCIIFFDMDEKHRSHSHNSHSYWFISSLSL